MHRHRRRTAHCASCAPTSHAFPFLELAGEYRNALEASRALEEQSVDLIFCDINMPDLSGIDFVRSLSAEQRPMIVFTTAYSEYAVEGFKPRSDRLPAQTLRFRRVQPCRTAGKSLSELIRSRREHPEETTESISLPQDSREFLSIKTDHMVSLVKFENIIYLESMGEYSAHPHDRRQDAHRASTGSKTWKQRCPPTPSCAYTAPTSSTCAASPAMPRAHLLLDRRKRLRSHRRELPRNLRRLYREGLQYA